MFVINACGINETPSNDASSSRFNPAVPVNDNSIDTFRFKIKLKEAELKGNYSDCLALCSAALCSVKKSSEAIELVLLKAKFLVLTKQTDEASDILSEIIKNDPENAEAISTLGLIFYHQGSLKKSIEVFESALKINKHLSETLYLERNARQLLKIIDKFPHVDSPKEEFTTSVIRLIEDGLEIDPTNREITKTLRFQHGLASFKNDRFRTAIQDLTEALKLDETNIEMFMLRAKSYIEVHFFDDAMIDLLEADNLNTGKCQKVEKEIEVLRRNIGKVYIAQTYYDFLEVSRNATHLEIALSFKSLSLLNQVNLRKASTSAEQRNIIFKFKRIEKAFAIMSDVAIKKKYDKILKNQEASIECPTLTTCCVNIGNGYQCCCGGIGSCMNGTCSGVGNCMRGFGSCISESCCSESGLKLMCKSLNCCNILIAFVILAVLKWIF